MSDTAPAKPTMAARCPYCGGVLRKKPGAATKCPHCKERILVRWSADDCLVLTEEQAHKFDRLRDSERQLRTFEREIGHEVYDQHRRRLAERFGGEPRRGDVFWSVLNALRLEHASEAQWGLYRNDTMTMAQCLIVDGRFEQAATFMLETLCWDLSNPPPLNDLSPGAVACLEDAIALGGLTRQSLRRLFATAAQNVVAQRARAADPMAAWRAIDAALTFAEDDE